MYHSDGSHRLGINNDGVAFYDSNTLLHSGNYSEYAVKKNVFINTAIADNEYGYGYVDGGWPEAGPAMVFGAGNHKAGIQVGALGSAIRYGYTAGTTSFTWRTILDENNYSDYALPITGGTVNGNVAIGGTTASEKLHVYGNVISTGAFNSYSENSHFHVKGKEIVGSYETNYFLCDSAPADGMDTWLSGRSIIFATGTTKTKRVTIGADGVTTFTKNCKAPDFVTTSDNRLKDFVSDIDLDFEALKLIPKKYYYWKDKSMGEDLQIGTSAQELAKIYPTCVSYDEVSDRYSVNYQKLSIVALAAIDKLHERVSELESKLND